MGIFKKMIYRDFEDILIKPSFESDFKSRSEVKLENDLDQIPICAANMYGVGTVSMALELQKNKMLTFLCKNIFNEVSYVPDNRFDDLNFNYAVPTFGITNKDMSSYLDFMSKYGDKVSFVCIDVANGHMKSVLKAYNEMKKEKPKVKFFVGNIANEYALDMYNSEGVYCSVVGIGSGSACSTRLKTGVGVPQASLIDHMAARRDNLDMNIRIMSDGGIKHVGDIVKAFVLGADYVMMGGMFAGHKESELSLNEESGTFLFKGSSADQSKDYVTPEGIYVDIPNRGSVESTIKDILGGLRSAGTYLDCHLKNFSDCKDQVIEVSRQKNNIFKEGC